MVDIKKKFNNIFSRADFTVRGCSSNNPCSSKKKTKPNPGAVTRRNFRLPQPQPTRSVHP